MKKPKIGIIGAGVFGLSAALELSKNDYPVTVFDRADDILTGASTVNHLRHHYGFHYPRSKETVEEIQKARVSFEKEFGNCVSNFFEDYYGVSLIGSQTTPENFIKFCNNMKLPYEIAWPDKEYLDRSKIGICIKTPERVYDPDRMRTILIEKISDTSMKMRMNSTIIGGEISGKLKTLEIESSDEISRETFDFLVNATYSNFNSFNKWFGFSRKKFQYEKMELLELEIPEQDKIGLTIMDGEFSSVLPRGEKKNRFTLGHVDASVLERVIGDDLDSAVMSYKNTKSNKYDILKRGIEDFPFLKKANLVKSLYVTRVVKPDVDDTDERPSEITDYGNGMYSIFGGKVITCVNIGKKIFELISEQEL